MLRPLVCIACEKVIMDRPLGTPDDQSGVASLISLFSKLIVRRPKGETIPANAAIPKDWTVFSLWVVEPGDEKKEYFICTQIHYPDATPFGDLHRLKLNISGNSQRTQVTINYNAFPIGQTGPYTIRTWIEEAMQTVAGPIGFAIEVEHET